MLKGSTDESRLGTLGTAATQTQGPRAVFQGTRQAPRTGVSVERLPVSQANW